MSTALIDRISDKVTHWVGSTSSIIFHTVFFILTILSHWVFGFQFSEIFLVLTTVVSLEAIYISIFIQRAVNQQGVRLGDVEESIDDVEEALDDVEEALEDVEEALDEDEAEEEQEAQEAAKKDESMDAMLLEMKKVLKELKAAVRDANKE